MQQSAVVAKNKLFHRKRAKLGNSRSRYGGSMKTIGPDFLLASEKMHHQSAEKIYESSENGVSVIRPAFF